jgi:UDP-N-acetylglucosamine transferase subunit ALG13
MIFVTVGTQVEPFKRLLKAVDEEIEKGTIKDTVIVQAGCTKYKSDNMIIHDYLPMEVFDEYMDQADLIICHGGVGSILGGLNRKKKVIAVARLKKYKEHVNDHQTQIIDNFIKQGYIIGIKDMSELGEAIKKSKTFKPKEYKSNRDNMIKLIEKLIDE